MAPAEVVLAGELRSPTGRVRAGGDLAAAGLLAAAVLLCLAALGGDVWGRSAAAAAALLVRPPAVSALRLVPNAVPRSAAPVAATASAEDSERQRVITSRQNPLAKRVRLLHDAKGRRELGLLLLEGTHMLQECLQRGLELDTVVATPEWVAQHPALVRQVPSDVPVSLVSADVLTSVATTVTPDGVLLVIPPPLKGRPHARRFVLALDFVQDPGNLGTLIRTAAAVDVEQIWMGGGADPYQPKVLRAAAGAALSLPVERLDDLAPRLREARAAGMQVVAAVAGGGGPATPYWAVDWTRPTVLLLGSEGRGLDPALLPLADHRVHIPHSA
eukprot:EG_transcript_19425